MAVDRRITVAATVALALKATLVSAVRVGVNETEGSASDAAEETPPTTYEADSKAWPKNWNDAERAAAGKFLGEWQDFELKVYGFEQIKGGLGFHDLSTDTWSKLVPSTEVYFEAQVQGRPIRFGIETSKGSASPVALRVEALEPSSGDMVWQRDREFLRSRTGELNAQQFLTPSMPSCNAALAKALMGTWKPPLAKLKSWLGQKGKTHLKKVVFSITEDGQLEVAINKNVTTVPLEASGVLFEGREAINPAVMHRFRQIEDGRVVRETKRSHSEWVMTSDMFPIGETRNLSSIMKSKPKVDSPPGRAEFNETFFGAAVDKIKAIKKKANEVIASAAGTDASEVHEVATASGNATSAKPNGKGGAAQQAASATVAVMVLMANLASPHGCFGIMS